MAKQKMNLARFFDEFALAGRGFLLATKTKTFWIPFIITFLVFGTLINLLSSGFVSFQLIGSSIGSGDFGAAFKIIGNAFLGIFGVGRNFVDWILNFALTFLQSVLIALVVFVAKHNKKEKKEKREKGKEDKSSGIESSAIVAGLVVLGSGCPTCGTTLIAPVIGALLSGTTGAMSYAGKISTILNIVAAILAILVFRKLGLQTYAIIKSEHFKEKQHEANS